MKNHRIEILLSILGLGLIRTIIFYSAKVPKENIQTTKPQTMKQRPSPRVEKPLEAPLVDQMTKETNIPASIGSSISRDELWALYKKHFPQLIFESYSGCPAGYVVSEADSHKLYCEKAIRLSDNWVHYFMLIYDAGVLAHYSEMILKEKQNDYKLIALDFNEGDISESIIYRRHEECFYLKFSNDIANALENIYESEHSTGEFDLLVPERQKRQIENKRKVESITKTLCTKYGDLRACENYSKLIKYDCI